MNSNILQVKQEKNVGMIIFSLDKVFYEKYRMEAKHGDAPFIDRLGFWCEQKFLILI